MRMAPLRRSDGIARHQHDQSMPDARGLGPVSHWLRRATPREPGRRSPRRAELLRTGGGRPRSRTGQVIPVRRPPGGQQAHGLVGDGHDLGAVGGFQGGVGTAPPAGGQPPAQPPGGDPGRGRKRRAVQPRDGAQQRVFHRAAGRRFQLAQPGPLTVPGGPQRDRRAQVMHLRTAMAAARPQVGQRPAQLGMPHQRGQVIQDHGHADVVDRAVCRQLDSPVGRGMPAEQPYVTGAGQVQGLIQADAHARHSRSLDRCAGGRYSAWQPSQAWRPAG